MTAILWATLIIAASSLAFALLAFRQVMATSRDLHETAVRVNKLMDSLPTDYTKVITPDFIGDVIVRVLTKGLRNPDGSSVSIHKMIEGYIIHYGPVVKEFMKEQMPSIIKTVLSTSDSNGNPVNDASAAGKALVAHRWGGLRAAKGAAKVVSKVGLGDLGAKISGYVEIGQAIKEAVPMLKELKDEIGLLSKTDKKLPDKHPGTAPRGQSNSWEHAV